MRDAILADLLPALWQGLFVLLAFLLGTLVGEGIRERRRKRHLDAIRAAHREHEANVDRIMSDSRAATEALVESDALERQAWLDRYAALRGVAIPVERQPAPPRSRRS